MKLTEIKIQLFLHTEADAELEAILEDLNRITKQWELNPEIEIGTIVAREY